MQVMRTARSLKNILARSWPMLTGLVAAIQLGSSANAGPPVTERLLHSFQRGSDGAFPSSGVISDAVGALYGTTSFGGSRECADNEGCGIVYRLTPTESGYSEEVIYSFPAAA